MSGIVVEHTVMKYFIRKPIEFSEKHTNDEFVVKP